MRPVCHRDEPISSTAKCMIISHMVKPILHSIMKYDTRTIMLLMLRFRISFMQRLTMKTLVVLLRSLLVMMTKEVRIFPKRPHSRAINITIAPICRAVAEGSSCELKFVELWVTLLLNADSEKLIL